MRGFRRTLCLLRRTYRVERSFLTSLLHFDDTGLTVRNISSGATLDQWRLRYFVSAPIKTSFGLPEPTVAGWLRKHGPSIPHGILQRLLRQRRIRTFDSNGVVRRATKAGKVANGQRILLPLDVLQPQAGGEPAHLDWEEQKRSAAPKQVQAPVPKQAIDELLQRVLYLNEDLLVLNKPSGLACQGGRGMKLSLDVLAAEGLRFGSSETPRLVHRLDRDVSGALVMARTPEAAAKLSASFRAPALRLLGDADMPKPEAALKVTKTYWALVRGPTHSLPPGGLLQSHLLPLLDEALPRAGHTHAGPNPRAGHDDAWLNPRAGHNDARLIPRAGHSAARLSLTRWRLLARHPDGWAWLLLQPITGRKHQLRVHCADELGLPILGDRLYGGRQSPEEAALLSTAAADRLGQTQHDFNPLLSAGQARQIMLHCRSITIKSADAQTGCLTVRAAPPALMESLIEMLGLRARSREEPGTAETCTHASDQPREQDEALRGQALDDSTWGEKEAATPLTIQQGRFHGKIGDGNGRPPAAPQDTIGGESRDGWWQDDLSSTSEVFTEGSWPSSSLPDMGPKDPCTARCTSTMYNSTAVGDGSGSRRALDGRGILETAGSRGTEDDGGTAMGMPVDAAIGQGGPKLRGVDSRYMHPSAVQREAGSGPVLVRKSDVGAALRQRKSADRESGERPSKARQPARLHPGPVRGRVSRPGRTARS
eukprot:jgi/Botrbrau1/19183/Bobra.0077s0089.1